MKHLTILLTMATTFTGLGQQMPYNPDANGDDFVGVDDVLGVLGVYDTALMQPDLTCDYEGTDLEQLFGGLMSGGLELDSLYVEYLFIDSVLTFNPECPDAVYEEVVLERSYVLPLYAFDTSQPLLPTIVAYTPYLGYSREFVLEYRYETGEFELKLYDEEVPTVTNYNPYSYTNPNRVSLPFPNTWTLDADGISIQWSSNSFAHNCQALRLIPFWHEAE